MGDGVGFISKKVQAPNAESLKSLKADLATFGTRADGINVQDSNVNPLRVHVTAGARWGSTIRDCVTKNGCAFV